MNNTGFTLSQLTHVIEIFTSMSRDFPAQYIETFLYVARKQGVIHKELVKATGLSGAAVTRNVQAMSPQVRNERPGYNLMQSDVSDEDARMRVVYLTEHGKEIAKQVLRYLGHEEDAALPAPEKPLGDRFSKEAGKFGCRCGVQKFC